MAFPDFLPVSTRRLILRRVAEADLPDLLAVNGDPQVTQFLPYATWRDLADAQAWLERMRKLEAEGGTCQLVLQRRDDATVIGTLLLFRFDSGSARAELGYVVGHSWWRQGYAREALSAAVAAAFGPLGLRRLEAEVAPGNVASNALLRSVGFVQEGRLRQRWMGRDGPHDVNVYGLLRDDPRP